MQPFLKKTASPASKKARKNPQEEDSNAGPSTAPVYGQQKSVQEKLRARIKRFSQTLQTIKNEIPKIDENGIDIHIFFGRRIRPAVTEMSSIRQRGLASEGDADLGAQIGKLEDVCSGILRDYRRVHDKPE